MKSIPWFVALLALGCLCVLITNHAHVKASLTEQSLCLSRKLDVLISENQRLSNALAQAESSRAASNDQLRELLRLRAEVARLRQETKELAGLREQNHQLLAVRGTNASIHGLPIVLDQSGYWPKESWSFAGYTSPESTLQTMLWFAKNGDVTNLLACGTADYRKNEEDDLVRNGLAHVTEELNREIAKLNSCRLLDKQVFSNDQIQLTLWMDGDHAETNRINFVRIGNEWKAAKHE
jgi:hypothetical protein